MTWLYHTLAALAGAAVSLIGFWLGGFDFATRGELAVTCYITTIIFTSGGLALSLLAHIN